MTIDIHQSCSLRCFFVGHMSFAKKWPYRNNKKRQHQSGHFTSLGGMKLETLDVGHQLLTPIQQAFTRGAPKIYLPQITPGKPSWWFQTFFIFTPSWGRFSFFLIFFIWVETTSQKPFGLSWFWIVKRWICWPKKAHSMHLFNMDGFVVQVNLYGPGTHGMKITMKKAHHFGRNMFGHFCPRNPSWGNTHLKTRLGGGFKSCFSPRSLGKWSNSTKDF